VSKATIVTPGLSTQMVKVSLDDNVNTVEIFITPCAMVCRQNVTETDQQHTRFCAKRYFTASVKADGQCLVTDYRFEYCGALRAFFRPYLRLSLIRASRVKNPRFLKYERKFGNSLIKALQRANRIACACALNPPPVT
jgi:hypothetical protein